VKKKLEISRGVALLLTVSSLAMLAASPAMAQDAQGDRTPAPDGQGATADAGEVATPSSPGPGGDIVVTGTRLRGVAPVGSNVIGLDAAQIEQTGLATTTDLLRSVPQISNIGMDESRTTGAQRAVANLSGVSAINLRGLGAEATLVLVNGRRPPIGGGEGRFFDTSAIPAIALQRIEIVADGASAIYGSDAMTGVANLVTRRSFEGLIVQGRYGIADDLESYQVALLAGHRWSTGNIVFAAEYYLRGNLRADDRPDLYDDTGFGSFAATPANLGPSTAPTSGFRDANGNGRLDPGEGTGNPVIRQSNWQGVDVLPEQERYSFLAHADQELGPVRLNLDLLYSRRMFERFGTALTISGQNVPATNPYNATGAAVSVNYSLISQLGNQRINGYAEDWQAALGAEVDLFADWRLTGYFSYGQDRNSRRRDQVNTGGLTAALTSTSTATAFNPFGPNSRTVLDSIRQIEHIYPVFDLTNAQAQFDGALFQLPGGAVRLAFGGEYQGIHRTQVTTTTRFNAASPAPVVSLTLEREVVSAFGELFIPIFGADNASPLARAFDISLAIRYDRYRDRQLVPALNVLDADTLNPKIGLRYQPFEDLTFRASWGRSFRAPALGDYSVGAPTSTGPTVISAAVAAANGLPALPVYTTTQIQGGHTFGLEPERARTWTAGFDWRPQGIPGLQASVTYYNIRFTNQITAPASTSVLNDPAFVSALRSAGSFVVPGQGLVIFNPTTAQLLSFLNFGGIYTAKLGAPAATLYGSGSTPTAGQVTPVYALIEALTHNGGVLETDGFDVTLDYAFNTSFGRIRLGDYFTYILNYRQSLISSAPLVSYLNQVNFPLRFVNRALVGLDSGGFSANMFVTYQNAYRNTTQTPAAPIDSYTTVDLSLSYDTGEGFGAGWLRNFRIALIGQNIFDSAPPFARVVQGVAIQSFDAQTGSAIGRMFSIQISKRF